jgi:hypothetical protein
MGKFLNQGASRTPLLREHLQRRANDEAAESAVESVKYASESYPAMSQFYVDPTKAREFHSINGW